MSEPRNVALCVTCLVDQIMPEVGVAAVKLLRQAGCQVDFPAEQTCCGQPFFNSGYQEQARDLAKRLIEIFEPYSCVVLPSGSCTTMIRHEYPHLFDGEPLWQERAEKLAAKTFELGEFLTEETDWQPAGQLPPNSSVTYHDSCHMCRMLGLKEHPRELLAAAGAELHEMEHSDRCCGFGGLFSIKMPEVSNEMTAAKVKRALATGAAQLVTSDPGCLMQMRGLAGDRITITHLAVLLAEASNA